MRLAIILLMVCLSGCVSQSQFEKTKTLLKQDIQILKLEIRKETLENELEILERN